MFICLTLVHMVDRDPPLTLRKFRFFGNPVKTPTKKLGMVTNAQHQSEKVETYIR